MALAPPPIYCALRYLFLWHTKERALHVGLVRQPSPATVRAALTHFRVARSFHGIAAGTNASFVVRSLLSAESRASLSPTGRVEFLAQRLRSRFGAVALSAASKLLWLRKQWPYVILDARAQNALRELGAQFANGDYAQYTLAWRQAFELARPSISAACAFVVKAPGIAASLSTTQQGVRHLVSQRWFEERVFDIYLWERGGAG